MQVLYCDARRDAYKIMEMSVEGLAWCSSAMTPALLSRMGCVIRPGMGLGWYERVNQFCGMGPTVKASAGLR
jgi:hypothetical protein